MSRPSCGLYRTTIQIGPVQAGRLVYFHNHGNPGPGIYLPTSWRANRAVFAREGTVLDDPGLADTLEPLSAEGFYRVNEAFTCCPKNCRTYVPGLLVQLGYDGAAAPILFVPQWDEDGLAIPTQGHRLTEAQIARLEPLKVEVARPPKDSEHMQ